MKINIETIKKEEIKLLNDLVQLYLSDINKVFKIEKDLSTGLYIYDDLNKYVDTNANYAYFIRKSDETIGFILLDKISEKDIEVKEIFIVEKHRNKKIGTDCMFLVFNSFKTNWIIKALPKSKKAENFWIKTISEYTENNYEIEYIGKYNRAVLKFKNF